MHLIGYKKTVWKHITIIIFLILSSSASANEDSTCVEVLSTIQGYSLGHSACYNADACFHAGVVYSDSKCTLYDPTKAVGFLQKAADLNHVDAQVYLAALLSSNEIPPDYEQAVALYEKAANQNHLRAQFMLGGIYLMGDWVEKDLIRSAYWYQEAAEQGHASAQYYLGFFYIQGVGVAKDNDKGMALLQKSAAQGHQGAAELLNKLGM